MTLSQLETGWRLVIARDLELLAESWRNPAAYEGTTMAGPIEMPGSDAATVALNEVVVHGWDLAVATGQPYAADPIVDPHLHRVRARVLDAGDRGPEG